MALPRLPHPRYPEVPECSWRCGGKCPEGKCRFSLLADRPRIADWNAEDRAALVAVLPTTCALDLASLGPMLLDEIATYLGLTRPQVEQLELSATRKLARHRELRRVHWDGH